MSNIRRSLAWLAGLPSIDEGPWLAHVQTITAHIEAQDSAARAVSALGGHGGGFVQVNTMHHTVEMSVKNWNSVMGYIREVTAAREALRATLLPEPSDE